MTMTIDTPRTEAAKAWHNRTMDCNYIFEKMAEMEQEIITQAATIKKLRKNPPVAGK